jgi:hypothetical protein
MVLDAAWLAASQSRAAGEEVGVWPEQIAFSEAEGFADGLSATEQTYG